MTVRRYFYYPTLPKKRMTITSLRQICAFKMIAGKFINEKVKKQGLKVISQYLDRPFRDYTYIGTLLRINCILVPGILRFHFLEAIDDMSNRALMGIQTLQASAVPSS